MLEIRVLGPVQALKDGGVLPVGGPRQQAVLVTLALRAGRRCSLEELIADVWGERPPEAAAKTARAYISRLRSVLGAEVLLSDAGGYQLALDPARVDARRFVSLVERARAALCDDAPVPAERLASEALELWRGRGVGDGAHVDGRSAEMQELLELRLVAEELRLDAALALGRFDTVILTAERLLADDPLREGCWERLMLALYRSGRQADALEAFTRARRTLVEELGLEPGPGLVVLQERILRHELPVTPVGDPGGHLPTPVTSFVGREQELQTLGELLSGARLVTLVGVGGSGKTRLAIEAASQWRAANGAPVWFVDLAPLRDPVLVPSAVMAALGAPELPGFEPVAACASRIGSRRQLVLLDNCEHVIDACAQASRSLLEQCPRLAVLATSRTPLGVAGETLYTVPPLATPEVLIAPSVIELAAGFDAVRLFMERARSADGSVPSGADLAIVAELCRRLDGLPLAIEFAAARTRSMSVAEILARMSNRFAVLVGARRSGPDRHRTLRAAIDWSHDLLAPEEQVLLRRLSVFDGGFTRDAAVEICADGMQSPIEVVLERLLDASLLTVHHSPATLRFSLFETVREYASERLVDRAERARTFARHAHYYCQLAEEAAARLRTPQEQVLLQRLDLEQDNLRAALRWAAAPRTASPALLARLAISLGHYWRLRGTLDEGARWLNAALAVADEGSVQQASLRIGLGAIRARQNDFAAAEPLLEAGVATARASDELALVASGLHWLAGAQQRQRRFDDAVALLREEVAIWEQLEEPVAATWPLGTLADLAAWQGHFSEAEAIYEQGLAAVRANGPPSYLVGYLHSMAELAVATRRFDRARALCDETLPIAREVGDVWHVGNLYILLARIERAAGNPAQASQHALTALESLERVRSISEIAEAVEVLGGIALDTNNHAHGALLIAGAKHLREASGVPMPYAALQAEIAADWTTAEQLCGPELNTIERHAATLTLEQLTAAAKRPAADQLAPATLGAST